MIGCEQEYKYIRLACLVVRAEQGNKLKIFFILEKFKKICIFFNFKSLFVRTTILSKKQSKKIFFLFNKNKKYIPTSFLTKLPQNDQRKMSLAFDDFGRPYIIIREQQQKKRLKGMEAYKVHPTR